MPADPQQLTPWFDGSVKPVREGIYQVRGMDGSNPFELMWHEGCWHLHDEGEPFAEAFFQDREWRGFTEEQK